MVISIRDFQTRDTQICRSLWVELTEHHRQLYDDLTIGGDDPGHGFDDYLAHSDRLGSWIADVDSSVVGLTGLISHGHSAEVEPVIVSSAHRGNGVGRQLIEHVVTEASSRGFDYLSIRPVARNVTAIQNFYRAGFQTLGGHIDLTLDLTARRHEWKDGVTLHGLDFRF